MNSVEIKLHRPVIKQRNHKNFLEAMLFSGIRSFVETLDVTLQLTMGNYSYKNTYWSREEECEVRK